MFHGLEYLLVSVLWKAGRVINVYTKVDDADNGKQPVFLSWKVHRYNKMLIVLQWVFSYSLCMMAYFLAHGERRKSKNLPKRHFVI